MKLYTTILLVISSYISISQCFEEPTLISNDDCEYVAMSVERHAVCYVAIRDAKTINEDIIPKLKSDIDSLWKVNLESKEANSLLLAVKDKKIEALNTNIEEVLEEQDKLNNLNKTLKKTTLGAILIGFIIGILIAK